MEENKILNYIKTVLDNLPAAWLNITTHRLDIYNEKLAKTQFLKQFEKLYKDNNTEQSALNELPTAYDYIRLGHPLSCLLEWTIAKQNNTPAENVICFSSATIPVLAILRKNLLENKNTQINYTRELPSYFDAEALKTVYGYQFELNKVESAQEITAFSGSTVFLSEQDDISHFELTPYINFFINTHTNLGSLLIVNGEQNEIYISEIQHVRRRETIAMTPINCLAVLKTIVHHSSVENTLYATEQNKSSVIESIKEITGSNTKAIVGSSGLSIQYAILMGLVDNALENHTGKDIKFIVPPNCYGGTNDQARRVAACIKNVQVMDLPVDGDHDMVQSIDLVLEQIAAEDAIPYIIAEIPTNPRVEVPDLQQLKAVLSKERKTKSGNIAIDPVFILDQTFCPNVHFLGENDILSTVRTISFASGSKFPSGGLCTSVYCTANRKAGILM